MDVHPVFSPVIILGLVIAGVLLGLCILILRD